MITLHKAQLSVPTVCVGSCEFGHFTIAGTVYVSDQRATLYQGSWGLTCTAEGHISSTLTPSQDFNWSLCARIWDTPV